jgi:hypothetical protein
MLTCCYILSDDDTKYSKILSDCKCVEGNRDELVRQITENEEFCRDKGIDYKYFCGTLKTETVIYIKNEENNILGACSIYLSEFIKIIGICVPHYKKDDIKGIGPLLLNNVKHIGKLIGAKNINLIINKISGPEKFYTDNGFEELTTFEEDEYDIDPEDNEHAIMIYKFPTTTKKEKQKKATKKKQQKKSNKKKQQKKEKVGIIKAKIDQEKLSKIGKTIFNSM